MLRLLANDTVLVGHSWQDIVVAVIVAFPATIAGILAWRSALKSKKNTQPNGGSSAYDLQTALILGRLDESRVTLERRIDGVDANLKDHLHSSGSYRDELGVILTEERKALYERLEKLEGKGAEGSPESQD